MSKVSKDDGDDDDADAKEGEDAHIQCDFGIQMQSQRPNAVGPG